MAYDFVIGVDVGKYFHHACVLDPQGRQILSTRASTSMKARYASSLANSSLTTPRSLSLSINPTTSAG